jgi:hypothetical protein
MQTHLIILAVLAATSRAVPIQRNHHILDDRQSQNPATVSSTMVKRSTLPTNGDGPTEAELAALQNTHEQRLEKEPEYRESLIEGIVEDRIRALGGTVEGGAEKAAKRL